MRKEYCYLPNLNSLFLQNADYQKHRYNIRNKSTHEHSRDLGVCSKEFQELHRKVLQLRAKDCKTVVVERPQTPIDKFQDYSLVRVMYDNDSPSVVKQNIVNLMPYSKRKLSNMSQQNSKIYQGEITINPVIMTPKSAKNKVVQQSLRQRPSKVIREGNAIIYKFKKSLKDIMKRKQKQQSKLEILPQMKEQLKKQLLALNEKRCKTVLDNQTHNDANAPYIAHSSKHSGSKAQEIQSNNKFRWKKSGKSERCLTDPCEMSSMVTRAKRYLKKQQTGLPTRIEVKSQKQQISQRLKKVPNSKKLLQRGMNSMHTVCFPQKIQKQ